MWLEYLCSHACIDTTDPNALVLQVPSACFVQPPLTYVGLTEEAAVEHLAGDLDIFVSKFRPLKYTISGRQEKTLMKIIVHVETNKVRTLQLLVLDCLPAQGCS